MQVLTLWRVLKLPTGKISCPSYSDMHPGIQIQELATCSLACQLGDEQLQFLIIKAIFENQIPCSDHRYPRFNVQVDHCANGLR